MRLIFAVVLAGSLTTSCYVPDAKALRDGLLEDCQLAPMMPDCVFAFDAPGPCCDAEWGNIGSGPEGCEPEPLHDACQDGSARQLVEKRAWKRAVRLAFQSEEEEQCVLEELVGELCSEEAEEEAIEEGAEHELMQQRSEKFSACTLLERGPAQQPSDAECVVGCQRLLAACGDDECDVAEVDACFDAFEICRVGCGEA